MTAHRALHLVARPEGLPKDSDFELRTSALAAPGDGQFRVAVRYLSIDPAMRVWMSEQKSYWPPVPLGDVMRASAIGEVVESRHPRFAVGAWVSGMLGVQDGLVSDGKGLRAFDPKQLPASGWALSIFGGTGLTAYFGLTEIGKPRGGRNPGGFGGGRGRGVHGGADRQDPRLPRDRHRRRRGEVRLRRATNSAPTA